VSQAGESERVQRFERQILVHLDDLHRAALRFTGHVADAEDLVQETCVRAFSALDQLRHEAAAKVWVFTILRSVFLRKVEREPARALLVSLEEIDEAASTASDVLRGSYESPLDYVLRHELRDAVLRLPLPYRETIILAYIVGFSYREIADILELPIGTVMSRLFRGRRMLRACLRDSRSRSESGS
jgi:RNA polymerase sigma-70 factor (ECF subfamily)